MRKSLAWFAAGLWALALTGCASNQAMSDADRAAVQSVYISPDVKKVDKPFYYGPTAAIGSLFGVVGALATMDKTADEATQLKEFAEKNNILIENIVREELSSAIRASGKLPLSDSAAGASATITINIKQYGFSLPNGFSRQLVPILFVQCTMTDKSGKVIGLGGDAIRPLGNPVPEVPLQAMQDPVVMEKQWRLGAQAVAKEIVRGLTGDEGP